MKHISVDLETLDTAATAVILSVGACFFDPATGALGPKFYSIPSVQSCRMAGLTTNADTLAWWESQSPEARAVLDDARKTFLSLDSVLKDFAAWIALYEDPAKVQVWGNGSDFDNAILNTAYRAVGRNVPWKYYNNRDLRTLKELAGVGKNEGPQREGTHHNALDDAVHQARLASYYWRKLFPPSAEQLHTEGIAAAHIEPRLHGEDVAGAIDSSGAVRLPTHYPVTPEHLQNPANALMESLTASGTASYEPSDGGDAD